MKHFTANMVQKWKIVMYASILIAFLMGLILCGNNIYAYHYLDSMSKSWEVQQIVFGTIYFIYIFLHLLILIGAKKSKSKILYVILVYWLLQVYWIISSKFSWVYTWLPLVKFRKSIIGNALWSINTISFMKSEEGNIVMPNLGFLITRQDRFHFYVALIFIILTVVCIKKSKQTNRK